MSINLTNCAAIIDGRWTAFKSVVLPKVLSIQFDADSIGYTIFALDGNVAYTTYIWIGTVPASDPSYGQAQNDADKADFVTNYLPYANGQILDNELDPRLIHRFGNLTSASASEVLMANQAYAEPASQGQRSIVSTSAQDAAAGTGAKAVRVIQGDSNYSFTTEDVVLNGTTPVNMVSTTSRFIEKFQVIQGAAAAGTIKIMTATAGGGTQIAAIGSGTEDAYLCHHYVPVGKRAWVLGWGATVDGNANFKLKGQQRFGANLVDQNLDLQNLFITNPNRPEFYRLFQTALPVGEKCYIRVTVVPGQATSTVERAALDVWEDKA